MARALAFALTIVLLAAPVHAQVLSVNGATGIVTIAGTTNQVSVTVGGSPITVSLPQNIHTGASPQFAGLGINGSAAGAGAREYINQGDTSLYALFVDYQTSGGTTGQATLFRTIESMATAEPAYIHWFQGEHRDGGPGSGFRYLVVAGHTITGGTPEKDYVALGAFTYGQSPGHMFGLFPYASAQCLPGHSPVNGACPEDNDHHVLGATTDTHVFGVEVNTDMQMNAGQKVGMQIVDVSTSTGTPSGLNIALRFANQPGAYGYAEGIRFDPGPQQPVRSDGKLITTNNGGSYKRGLDFSGSSFSDAAIRMGGGGAGKGAFLRYSSNGVFDIVDTAYQRSLFAVHDSGPVYLPSISVGSGTAVLANTTDFNSLHLQSSSRRYKHAIHGLSDDEVTRLADGLAGAAIVYRSSIPTDDPSQEWFGFVAEDLADLDGRLVNWSYRAEDYVADGPERHLRPGAQKVPAAVQYDRVGVVLAAQMGLLERRLRAAEQEIERLRSAASEARARAN